MAATVVPPSSARDMPLDEAIAALERMGRLTVSPNSTIDVAGEGLLQTDAGAPDGTSQAARLSKAHLRYRA